MAHVSHGSRRIRDLGCDICQPTSSIARVSLTDRGNRATPTADLARLPRLATSLPRLPTATSQICGAELVISRADGSHVGCIVGGHRSGTHSNGFPLVESLATSTTACNLLAATAS